MDIFEGKMRIMPTGFGSKSLNEEEPGSTRRVDPGNRLEVLGEEIVRLSYSQGRI